MLGMQILVLWSASRCPRLLRRTAAAVRRFPTATATLFVFGLIAFSHQEQTQFPRHAISSLVFQVRAVEIRKLTSHHFVDSFVAQSLQFAALLQLDEANRLCSLVICRRIENTLQEDRKNAEGASMRAIRIT